MSEIPEAPPSGQSEGSVPPAVAPPAASVDRRLFYTVAGIAGLLALMLVALVGWNRFTVFRLDQTAQAERVQMTTARQKALNIQGREILRLAGVPLGWAVRAEVLKGNLQQVDDYFRRFVREPGVESMLYIDKAGLVAVATDRKLEGQPGSGLVSAALLDATELTFEEKPPGLRLAIPVMGFDEKVGVLVLDYTLPDPEMKSPPAAASPAGN